MEMKEIITKAEEYALEEIEKYGTPKKEHFVLANKKGQELAEKLGVDKDVVLLGTILMDLKIGEAIKNNKLSEHVKMSSDASKKFLEQFNLDENILEKILNCIDAHHKDKEFACKEAEICANADCYRFLTLRGVFGALVLWGRRNESVDFCLENLEKKVEEKYKILSLDICKEELKENYKLIKRLIEEGRN